MPRLIELSYYSSLHCFQFSLKLIGKRRAMNIAKEVSDLWVSFPLWRQIVQMSKWSLRSHSNVSQPKLYSRRAFGLTSSLKGGVTSPTRHSYLSMFSLLLLTIPVMVNFCVVKDLCACTPGLTVHKFPRNAERRKTWVAKVPLKNFAATHEMQSNSNALCLINQTCQSGCRYQDKIEKIATATFNLKATNYVSAANDKIRCDKIQTSKKRKAGSHKKSPTARKVKKLSSSWQAHEM